MNIFYLDDDPSVCARYHCDKHVVKMVLETAQMLCTAHHVLDGPKPGIYKLTHINHPCNKWIRHSRANYFFGYYLYRYLCIEYYNRFRKFHASSKLDYLLNIGPQELKNDKRDYYIGFTEPPQCMPDEYKHEDTVTAYRQYYKSKTFAEWKYTEQPEWW